MSLDFARLAGAVDPELLGIRKVAVIGCGGSFHLVTNLARCGVGRFHLSDPDIVSAQNICRTDFLPSDIGQPKVKVLANALRAICPNIEVETSMKDYWHDLPTAAPHEMSCSPIACQPNLVIAATDSFAAQARANELALRMRSPALFVGLLEEGLGGEIVFWHPGLPCFRCLMAARYRLHEENRDQVRPQDPPSTGATIFETDFVDAIAGQIGMGLLLRGTPTRFGRLLETLGNRNFLRIKIDPSFLLRGRDLVREELGIPLDNTHFTGWCISAQSDPDRGQPPCADCTAAGHQACDESRAFLFSPPNRSTRA